MRNYELMVIYRPNLDDDTRAAEIEKVSNLIADGGEVVKVEEWGSKRLAYEIEKVSEGYYTLFRFKANNEMPEKLDRNLRINDKYLRHLVVNVDAK